MLCWMFQGVYVLLDSRFKLLTQISNTKQYMELAPKVIIFFICKKYVSELSGEQKIVTYSEVSTAKFSDIPQTTWKLTKIWWVQ